MTAWAFPKPTRPEKPRKRNGLARRKPLQAKHWGVSRGPSKTAHARRPRGWGKMLFLRTLPCDVPAAFVELYGPAVASVSSCNDDNHNEERTWRQRRRVGTASRRPSVR